LSTIFIIQWCHQNIFTLRQDFILEIGYCNTGVTGIAKFFIQKHSKALEQRINLIHRLLSK
jgi:hypothetical protein